MVAQNVFLLPWISKLFGLNLLDNELKNISVWFVERKLLLDIKRYLIN